MRTVALLLVTEALATCSAAGTCHSPGQTDEAAERPLGVLLAYTYGTSTRSCLPYFTRSFAALSTSRTDLVVLYEDTVSCN